MTGPEANQYQLPFRLDGAARMRIRERVRALLAQDAPEGAEEELVQWLTQSATEKAIAEAIISSVGAGVTVQDRQYRVVYQNALMRQHFGGQLGKTCFNAYQHADGVCIDCPVTSCFQDGATHISERRMLVQGNLIVVEKLASPIIDADGAVIGAVEVVRDVTSRRETEERLARISNLYQALSHTNKAIMQIPDRDRLLQQICQVAVQYGRFCLAWIGFPDAGTGLLRPVAQSGEALGYLEGLVAYSDGEGAEGQGPSGTAIREQTPYLCNDFQSDPRTKPWHAAARRHNIRSSATFPLGPTPAQMGVLKVYSQHRSFFDAEMVELLEEMAANIAFALDNFAREEQRRRAEQALKESEERLKLVLEGSREGFWDWDLAGGTFTVSDRFLEMLGYSPGCLDPSPEAIAALVHSDDQPRRSQALERHLSGETEAYEAEFRMRSGSGAWVWIQERGKVVARSAEGAPLRATGTSCDITERKYFEENLQYVSTHDSMTGLYNRAYYDAELGRLAQGRSYPVSVIVADVDGLKHVNDSFGHSEGDRLIKQAAQALKDTFRAEDLVARIGGDEFAVLLPGADAEAAREALRRVRECQAAINRGNTDYLLSLSIGSATAENPGQLAEAVRLADSRMYYYKFQRKTMKG